MNCEQFESLLNQSLDDRREPSREKVLCEHVKGCKPCGDLFEIYSVIGKLGSLPSRRNRFRAGYVVTALAASILVVLLSPLSEFLSQTSETVNLAHADPDHAFNHKEPLKNSAGNRRSYSSSTAGRVFAKTVPFERLGFSMPANFHLASGFQLSVNPDLQKIEKSFNTVWDSIHGDDFLLPLIKQSALFWVP